MNSDQNFSYLIVSLIVTVLEPSSVAIVAVTPIAPVKCLVLPCTDQPLTFYFFS